MGWKERTPTKVTFNKEGMEIEGRLSNISPTQLGVNSYTLITGEDELLSFLGTAVLDRILSKELNSLIKIKYLGEVKTGKGFKVKQFEVHVWEDEESLGEKGDVSL